MKIHEVNKTCAVYKEKVKRVDTNNKKQIFLLSLFYIFTRTLMMASYGRNM